MPITADLVTRTQASGIYFSFLMTGVATEYTEIMPLRETTGSWKIAWCLPLVLRCHRLFYFVGLWRWLESNL